MSDETNISITKTVDGKRFTPISVDAHLILKTNRHGDTWSIAVFLSRSDAVSEFETLVHDDARQLHRSNYRIERVALFN